MLRPVIVLLLHAVCCLATSLRATSREKDVAIEQQTYGFYLHTFSQPKACIHQLRDIRRLYPESPVYVMSDGGMNFTGLCQDIGNCNFQWRPPANDRWNPKPFLERFREAVQWLNTKYVIMLEPDVTIEERISAEPSADAGGLRDANPALHTELQQYIEKLGRQSSGNSHFALQWDRFGLAGGMYVRSAAALDAFDASFIDWHKAMQLDSKRVFSSDVAMALVLAARGYTYSPWDDVTQKRFEEAWHQTPRSVAFRHHGSDESPKPFYNMPLDPDETHLVTYTANVGAVTCQHCVWVSDEECWKQTPLRCPTDENWS